MELYEKYQSNPEFQSVIDRCRTSLEGANISQEDFENICLTVYGFQETKAKEYDLDMEKVYYNLSKLEGIYFKEAEYFSEMEFDDETRSGEFAQLSETYEGNDSHMAILSDNSTISSERVSAIYLNEDIEMSPEERFEATAHELQHLFQTQYQYNADNRLDFEKLLIGSGFGDATVEAFSQSTTRDILGYLGVETPSARLGIIDEYDGKTCVVPVIGDVYSNLQPIAKELERVDGEAIFRTLYDGERYSGELNFRNFEKVLNAAYEYDFDSHIRLMDMLKAKADVELVSGQITNTQYLETLGHLDKISPLIHTGSSDIHMLNASTDAQMVDMFYKGINGEKRLEDLSHLTRSTDCQNFLIALQAVRDLAADGKVQLTAENIDNMKYFQLDSGDEKSRLIAVEFKDKTYQVSAMVSNDYGISRVTKIDPLEHNFESIIVPERDTFLSFRKLIDDKVFFADDSTILKQIPTNSEMSLYMAYACASETSPNLMALNRFRMYPDITSISDFEGNNLGHILAENNSAQMTRTMKYFNPEQLRELLTTPNDNGITPIDIAIQNNNIKFFETISYMGITPNMNYENTNCQSPLIASLSPDVDTKITKIILEDFNADPNKLTSEGKLALTQALSVSTTQIEKVELLINNGADVNLPSYVNNSDPIFYTATQVAAGMSDVSQNLEALKICLTEGGDIFEENNAGNSVFEQAIRTHDVEILVAAAESGYDREDLDVGELKDVGFKAEDIERIEEAIRDYDNDIAFV